MPISFSSPQEGTAEMQKSCIPGGLRGDGANSHGAATLTTQVLGTSKYFMWGLGELGKGRMFWVALD